MRDLADRWNAIKGYWKEAGVCSECFADLKGDIMGGPQEHYKWCDVEDAALGVTEDADGH